MTIKAFATATQTPERTVKAWIKSGYIATNSNGVITSHESKRVTKLIEKYGRRDWLLYNNNAVDQAPGTVEQEPESRSRKPREISIPKGYLSTTEFAKAIGRTRGSVSNWCASGKVKAIDLTLQELREKDSHSPIYAIPKKELSRVKNAIKKYGRRWAMYRIDDPENTDDGCLLPDQLPENLEPIPVPITISDITVSNESEEVVKVVPRIKCLTPQINQDTVDMANVEMIDEAISKLQSLKEMISELDTINSDILRLEERRKELATQIKILKDQCGL